jgi:RNase P/RNase MRP subunit p29
MAKASEAKPQSPEVKTPEGRAAPDAGAPSDPTSGAVTERGTRTIPVTHGVVLRPSARVVIGPPAEPVTPMKNIEQLMAEADPVKTLRQTGSIHLLKRLAPDPAAPPVPLTPAAPAPASTPHPVTAPAASPSPWPQFAAKTPAPAPVEVKKPEPDIVFTPTPAPVLNEVSKPRVEETPFILKHTNPTENAPPVPPQIVEPTSSPLMSIFRRKAKLADVARIVLPPPKREESTRLPFPPHPELSPTVVPPAFPVAAMTQRPVKLVAEMAEPVKVASETKVESPFLERSANPPSGTEVTPKSVEPAMPAPAPEQKVAEPMSLFPDTPKVDPEAHKPEQVDPEAHRPPPQPAPPTSAETSTALKVVPESRSQEKREFHLTNGEHVAGVVLSETPEAIYVEHATLGVITVPRKEIAKRLVEIILTNGDRIVGDIMAETADTLYVRHASLGMLTVPRSHRSQRVVEAILKDGDRILGEVLTETDTFTVIRSATLGTITVPHNKMAMLNRKIEQVDMKALPPPELKDKSST